MRPISLLLPSLLAACSGASPTPETPLAPKCGGEPEFEGPAAALEAPESFVSVAVSLPKEQLEEQLSNAVPWTLAKARGRSAGAAGNVTYEVRREPLRLQVSDGQLVVSTHLVADIDVCKPLGPVCLHYGKCRPEWQATITVPSVVSLDDAPRPRMALGITHGCILSPVGYDATPELERITREQARNARAEISRRVAAAHARLVAAVREARQGFALGEQGCVSVEPLAVQQTPLVDREGQFGFALRASARVGFECDPRSSPRQPYEGAPDPLPSTETVSAVDEHSRVLLTRDLRYEELAKALGRQGVSVRLSSGLVAGRAHLVAGLSGLGRCEPEWVEVESRLEAGQVVLQPVPAGADSPAARWLQANGRADLPPELGRVQARLEDVQALKSEFERRLDPGVRLLGPVEVRPVTVPGAEALRVGYELAATLRVTGAESGT